MPRAFNIPEEKQCNPSPSGTLHADYSKHLPADLKSGEVLAVLGGDRPQTVEQRFRSQGQGNVVAVAEVARSHVGLREHRLIV